MTKPEIKTSYVICAVQRSGSFLLCEALRNTGLGGNPEEYFLYWEDGDWAQSKGVGTRHEFLDLVRREGSSANGVFGIKLMWNYFSDSITKLKELPEYGPLDSQQILEAVFPNVNYIWMVRNDKVRQAVSWAIAAQTSIYAAWQAAYQTPNQEPAFDFEQIDLLYRLILEGEAGWQAFFESNNIEPLKIVYEDLVESYEETGVQVLDFLNVSYPQNFVYAGERKMKKQGNQINIEWAEKYRKLKLEREGLAI